MSHAREPWGGGVVFGNCWLLFKKGHLRPSTLGMAIRLTTSRRQRQVVRSVLLIILMLPLLAVCGRCCDR